MPVLGNKEKHCEIEIDWIPYTSKQEEIEKNKSKRNQKTTILFIYLFIELNQKTLLVNQKKYFWLS